MYGFSTSGIFGYSHLMGGYAGGQAEYARVPFADVGPFKVPQDLPDEKVVFLTDIYPTAYMAAENCNIQPGDTVAVWGCGPVGQFTIRCAYLLGAGQVIAIDDRSRVPERLKMAEDGNAITIDMRSEDVYDRLLELTGGIGPDACIDAVGMEAHGMTLDAVYDKVKAALLMETERPHALRQAIESCRKGGVVSIPGVYGGLSDKIPLGAIMNKGLTIRTGQTHVHRYLPDLLQRIQQGQIDPGFVITHQLPLTEAPNAYKMFNEKTDGCIKVVLKPEM
jgi:threonine dehydrogenase-like Zn-dependent dehydrogenase